MYLGWRRLSSLMRYAVSLWKICLLWIWQWLHVHMQLWDVSSKSRFHAQMWKFKKSTSTSENAARRHMVEQKWAQFQPPSWSTEGMCNFANNLCASFSLLCQNWHADLEFACKFCFLVSMGRAHFSQPTFLTHLSMDLWVISTSTRPDCWMLGNGEH